MDEKNLLSSNRENSIAKLTCNADERGQMVRIAVCDDEKYYREKIMKLLKKEFGKRELQDYVIDEYVAGTELLKENHLLVYDIIFLDINMPEVNGMEIAERIRKAHPRVVLVFITAFVDYALEGYKTEAIRFLLKDMLEQSFPECIEAIIRKLSLQAYKVKCNSKEGEKEVPVDRICYIESMAHKLLFHISGIEAQQYSVYDKLDHMEEILEGYGFLRIHKSYLVNVKYVDEFACYVVKLKNGKQLPVPREKYQQVKERFYEMVGDML